MRESAQHFEVPHKVALEGFCDYSPGVLRIALLNVREARARADQDACRLRVLAAGAAPRAPRP